jgi:hypothetical protein
MVIRTQTNMYIENNRNMLYRKSRLVNRGIQFCFIIPEYMNKSIIDKGNKKQKEHAWNNLILTEQLRGRRLVTGLISSMFSVSD